jgi:hypothetical protein
MDKNDPESDLDPIEVASTLREAALACALRMSEDVAKVDPRSIARLPEIAGSNEAFRALNSDIHVLLNAETFIRAVKSAHTLSNLKKIVSDADTAHAKEKARLDSLEWEKSVYLRDLELDQSAATLDALAVRPDNPRSQELEDGIKAAAALIDHARAHSVGTDKTMRTLNSAQASVEQFVGKMTDWQGAKNNSEQRALDRSRIVARWIRWTALAGISIVVPLAALLMSAKFGGVWAVAFASAFAVVVFIVDKVLGTCLGRRIQRLQYQALKSEVARHGDMLGSLFLFEAQLNGERSARGLRALRVVDQEAFSPWKTDH